MEIGLIISPGASFHSISLIVFLIFSTIATKYTYEISKGCAQRFRSYIVFDGNWLIIAPGASFCSISLIVFLICSTIAAKYTYKI
jgi:hypothetical protein